MPAGGKPTVRSRRLGSALKRLREAAGVDQSVAAQAILRSVTKVSRLESGQVSASALEVRTLLDCYGVRDGDERRRLEELARASNQRGWWFDYQETLRPDYADHITLESDSTYIRSWEPSLIPGLLQTPEYAESVISSGPSFIPQERIAQLVEVRQERQRRIEDGGVHFTAIIWEPAIAALRHDPAVRDGQLRRLLDAGQRQNVTVQILPAAASKAAGMSGAFVAFSFGIEPNVEAVAVRTAANTTVVEAPEDLAAYVNVFDLLRSAAMSAEESAERIRQTLGGVVPDQMEEAK
ncbi:helix-turn-helix transcriptional regulator [Streptomyces sp. NPDC006482]|uniref:helix-turn-helix domain-containing protein n=1 Tax=unclassified Streptomyces TaxID=2593676 RepID=UPI002259A8FD|nr:helix-turn-helix transcriptional regulator [Streptomyces sp. NBC_00094]MCX5391225.1 helix-turn-helix domain-containing protein [Streptomyces sp. NBC_00094]